MRIPFALSLSILAVLAACASGPQRNPAQFLGKVQERNIVSTSVEGFAARPHMPVRDRPIRERTMSSQPFQETVVKPVYEHLVVLEDGRTMRIQTTSSSYPVGACVSVSDGMQPERPQVSAGSGCR